MHTRLCSYSLALTGVAALALGCGGSDLTLPNQGLPAKISIIRGDAQTAPVGSALPDSVLVRVTDSKDRPVQSQQVTFAASAGTVVPTAATTNADGRAGAIWVLGPVAGPQTVTATATGNGAPAGLAVTFHATATTSAAAKLDKAAGDAQTATAGSAVATPPSVKVSDKDGNPVAGVAVTFAVAGGGGAVNPTTPVTTNASGLAAVTSWTLGTVAGPNTLTATIGLAGIAGNPATFTATGTVGSAGRLAMARQPSATAQSGVPFAQQPKLQMQDAGGNPVKTAGLAVTATIASGAGGTLTGQLTVATDANGVATFTNLVLTGPLGSYTLGFTSPTLSGAASAAIALGAGAAAQLVIVQQPAAAAQSGVPLTQQPVVQLEDVQGNLVAQAGVAVTAAVNGAGGTLSGTKVQPTDATGKATFTDLVITGSNGQYALSFTSASPALASVPSSTIGLGAGTPTKLFLATAPSASAVNGEVFPQQPAIQVQDGAGNPVAAPGITVVVAITAGGGTLGGTTTAVTNASGLATFAGLSITGAIGPHQLTFTSTTPPLTFTTANVTLAAAAATKLLPNSATSQSGSVGGPVPAPPSVLVEDASSNPVSGVAVTFAVTSGGGTISPTTPVTTNASGVATLTTWTLGASPGPNTVTASATGLTGSPVTFSASGIGTLTVTAATPLPSAEAGVVYSTAITVAGGSAPYTWSLSSGTLPSGLALSAGTGVISGTPGLAGTPPAFTIRVTDVTTASASKAFTITILPAVTISTASLPGGTIGVVYGQTLAASNGLAPYIWTLAAGALPAGLALTSTTGAISGTPTAAGPFNFTIRVTDALGGTTTRAYSGTIASAPSVTTASLPNGEIGVPYNANLAGSGGTLPYSWSLPIGTLPAGLTLSSSGTISGAPTAPSGTSSFTVQLTDAGSATASRGLSILVQPAVAITTGSLQNGAVGVAYSQTLAASGGQGALTWNIASGSLPTGLTLNSGTGVISGTPSSTVGSPFNFSIRVTDGLGGTATQAYVVSIASAPTITNSSPLPAGEVNVPYSGVTLTGTGGQPPYTFGGSVPAGLSLNSTTGAITGTPLVSTTVPITFQIADANTASSTKKLTLPVRAAVTITTTSLPAGSVGTPYSQTVVASNGQTPFTWTVSSGALPSPLSLNSASGAITGTPATAGPNNFTIKVTDSLGGTDTQTYSVTIGAASSTTSVVSSDVSAVFGETLTFTATVTGAGTPTGSVTFRDGSCGGTLLDTKTLSGGSATSAGINSLSVTTHTISACYSGDSNFNPSSNSVTQIVVQASTTTTVSLPGGGSSVVGQSYTVSFSVSVSSPGSGAPTGNVTVSDGTNTCQGSVASGSCTLASTSSGNKSITATYPGDASFITSTSSAATQIVNSANTTTTITSVVPEPSSVLASIQVFFTVAPTAPGAGTPTGTVTVSDGTLSCQAGATVGSCSFIPAALLPGPITLTATYAGDSNFNPSTSPGFTHTLQ